MDAKPVPQMVTPQASPVPRGIIRFDRNELSGAFGDLGTDFPLVAGMILVGGLDATNVLTMFGLMQILAGLIYRLPMPVQPLKAMAVIVITQKLSSNVLYGGGLAIGVLMLLLVLSGLIDWMGRIVPKTVIRGIQFGLGLQLALLSLREYIPSDSTFGFGLAAVGFLITVVLLGNRRFPPAPILILLGVTYGVLFKTDANSWRGAIGLHLPRLTPLQATDILTGLVVLALPQLPLSLGNSLLATRQLVQDLFPERPVTLRKIGLTYALMNLINPFFGGIPTCHGSGGIAGHYAFGARTGGSVIIEGLFYLILGVFLSPGFRTIIELFPKPILGIILLFEALALMRLLTDIAQSRADFTLALLIGLAAAALPYGYVVGLVGGTVLAYWGKSRFARP
ncbi:MAG TPA: putative sulfate/molybdate transporter [Blastocatellia bacterium]|nr:putative sulfate/molybdate transporter [Blastocatellia bacterium]